MIMRMINSQETSLLNGRAGDISQRNGIPLIKFQDVSKTIALIFHIIITTRLGELARMVIRETSE